MALRLGYSIKALGGTLGGQWERTRRDTLFLMGAVLLSAVPQFSGQPARPKPISRKTGRL